MGGGRIPDRYRTVFGLHLDTVFCPEVDGCPLNMSTIQDYALMTTSTVPAHLRAGAKIQIAGR